MHHKTIGTRVYEFMQQSDAHAAAELYKRFMGDQDQFERAMTFKHILFSVNDYDSKRVYRVDLTKSPSPFCVVANTIEEAATWVRTNVAQAGFCVTNMRGY